MDALTGSLNLTLAELPDDGCRYIAGDDRLFCGLPQQPGKSYCPRCCSIVYQRVNEANRIERPHFARTIRKNNIPTIIQLIAHGDAS